MEFNEYNPDKGANISIRITLSNKLFRQPQTLYGTSILMKEFLFFSEIYFTAFGKSLTDV